MNEEYKHSHRYNVTLVTAVLWKSFSRACGSAPSQCPCYFITRMWSDDLTECSGPTRPELVRVAMIEMQIHHSLTKSCELARRAWCAKIMCIMQRCYNACFTSALYTGVPM